MLKKICSNGNRRPIRYENWNGVIAIRCDGNIVQVCTHDIQTFSKHKEIFILIIFDIQPAYFKKTQLYAIALKYTIREVLLDSFVLFV